MFTKHPLNIIQRAACGNLISGSGYDCSNPLVSGVNSDLILMDKEVFDTATVVYDVAQDNLITNITLTGTGNQAYKFEGFRTSNNPSTELSLQTVSVGYTHICNFLVFDISAAQKENLEKMALGNGLVAIVENKNAPGNADSVFEVFGSFAGLTVQTNTRVNQDLETNGAYQLELRTDPNSGQEPRLPLSFWDTDYATTKAKVEALLTPVP